MKDNSKAFSVRNLQHEIAYILWRTTIFPRVKTNLVGRETSSYISVNLFTMWVKRKVDLSICIQSLLMACHLEILKHSSVKRLRLYEVVLIWWTFHKCPGGIWTFKTFVVHLGWMFKFGCLFLLLEYDNDNWINSDFQRYNIPLTFNIHLLCLAKNEHSLNVCWINHRFPILPLVGNIHYNNVKTNSGVPNG